MVYIVYIDKFTIYRFNNFDEVCLNLIGKYCQLHPIMEYTEINNDIPLRSDRTLFAHTLWN